MRVTPEAPHSNIPQPDHISRITTGIVQAVPLLPLGATRMWTRGSDRQRNRTRDHAPALLQHVRRPEAFFMAVSSIL